MKSAIAFVAIALIFIVWAPQSKAKECTVTCNTDNDAEVCGRNAGTDNCRLFPDMCRLRLFNCLNDRSFEKVAIERCRGIDVGTNGVCRVAGSATQSTSTQQYE